MIHICYTPPHSLDISGAPAELLDLADRILKINGKVSPSFELLACSACDPAPYQQLVPRLRVQVDSAPTCLTMAPGLLTIAGAQPNLEAVAEGIKNLAHGTSDGRHFHYEHYEGNQWISPASIPAVISVQRWQCV